MPMLRVTRTTIWQGEEVYKEEVEVPWILDQDELGLNEFAHLIKQAFPAAHD